jgi:tetratricopeptide (TPR) repeat protein
VQQLRAPWSGPALAAAGLVVCAVALGGAHVGVVLALGPLFIAAAWLTLGRSDAPTSIVVFRAALLLALYCLVQAMPLPASWVAALNPHAGDVWRRALHPLGESVRWAALSLDPGATVLESYKLFLYAVAALCAATTTARYGAHASGLLLFGSAVFVATLTLAHGVVDARSVFGIYEPRFGVSRWRIGPLLNTNNLAGYLNLGLLCGLGLLMSSRFRPYRLPISAGVALVVGCGALSGSRAGVLSMFAGVAVFLLLPRRCAAPRQGHSGPAVALVGLALAIGGGMLLALIGAQETNWRELFQREVGKLHMIRRSLAMVPDFPIFGIGRGAFESVSPAYAVASDHHVAAQPENLLAQWSIEWGVPATVVLVVLGLRGLARQNVRASSVRNGLCAGLAALLAQNLLDMGLEVPALGLAAAWTIGALSHQGPDPRASLARGARAGRLWTPTIVGAGSVLWCLTLLYGSTPLSDEKSSVREVVASSAARSQMGFEAALHALRGAMLRHPAEPYFPRLGGWLALRAGGDPLPWVTRALERDLNGGRTRMLAAQALQKRGATEQALGLLRSAAELEPALASAAGRLAGSWTQDCERIELAAPRGTIGAEVLVNAARELEPSNQERARCLDAAVARDPSFAPARRQRLRDVSDSLSRGRCTEPGACAARGLADADVLERLAPGSADPAISRAILLAAEPAVALDQLEARCGNLLAWERARCFAEVVRLAGRQPEVSARRLRSAALATLEACEDGSDACSRLLTEIAGLTAAHGGWDLALRIYERAVATFPTAEALLGLAASASELGQFGRAQRVLEQVTQLGVHDEAMLERVRRQKDALRRQMLKRSVGLP